MKAPKGMVVAVTCGSGAALFVGSAVSQKSLACGIAAGVLGLLCVLSIVGVLVGEVRAGRWGGAIARDSFTMIMIRFSEGTFLRAEDEWGGLCGPILETQEVRNGRETEVVLDLLWPIAFKSGTIRTEQSFRFDFEGIDMKCVVVRVDSRGRDWIEEQEHMRYVPDGTELLLSGDTAPVWRIALKAYLGLRSGDFVKDEQLMVRGRKRRDILGSSSVS